MNNINIHLSNVPLNEALTTVEKDVYKHAMEAAKFNKSRAAKLIGVSRGTMYHKLREFFRGVYTD